LIHFIKRQYSQYHTSRSSKTDPKMADGVSFKGFLKSSTPGESEVRRFLVDKDVSSNFVYLQEKVATVYPTLKHKLFNISWVDSDGDEVTIASDDELVIALTEMTGPVYKINISIKGEKKSEQTATKEGESAGEGELHVGVTCDGCEGPVIGARYKCVVCPDYDLCSKCEAKGLHPGHNMIKMTAPGTAWPGHFFRRLHKMQERAEKREKRRGEDKEEQPAAGGPEAGGCTWRGRGGRGWGGWGRGRGGCGTGPFRFPMGAGMGGGWEAMMNGWMGPEPTGNPTADAAAHAEVARKAHEAAVKRAEAAGTFAHAAAMKEAEAASKAAHEAAQGAAAAAAAGAAGPQGQQGQGAEAYLMNMGSLIAAAMDPFGINVDISVETPDGVKTNVASSSSSSTSSTTTSSDKKEEEPTEKMDVEKSPAPEMEATPVLEKETVPEKEITPEPEKEKTPELEKEMTPEPVKESTPEKSSGRSTPSESDEWVMMDENQKVTNIPIKITDETPKVLHVDPKGVAYPTLPAEEPTPPVVETAAATAPVAPAVEPEHPDPRIRVALQAMTNMGFSNEGGWLTSLLEAKQGDIGKVLDLLQPVRK